MCINCALLPNAMQLHIAGTFRFCRAMLCIARLFPSPMSVRLSVRLCVRHVRELRQND